MSEKISLDSSEIDSFFHEYKLLFYQKQLEKFLQTRVAGCGRSGCGRCGDPDLDETRTGM